MGRFYTIDDCYRLLNIHRWDVDFRARQLRIQLRYLLGPSQPPVFTEEEFQRIKAWKPISTDPEAYRIISDEDAALEMGLPVKEVRLLAHQGKLEGRQWDPIRGFRTVTLASVRALQAQRNKP